MMGDRYQVLSLSHSYPHLVPSAPLRLDTDVAMGLAGGLRTVLTLSGVATLSDAHAAAEAGVGPDAVVPCVATLAGVQ